jgi:hypothetical protein
MDPRIRIRIRNTEIEHMFHTILTQNVLNSGARIRHPVPILREMAHRLMGQSLQRLRVLVDLAVRLVVLAGVVEHQREIRDSVLQRLVGVVAQLYQRKKD